MFEKNVWFEFVGGIYINFNGLFKYYISQLALFWSGCFISYKKMFLNLPE